MATHPPSAAAVKNAYIPLVHGAVIKRGENSISGRKPFVLQEAEFLENFVCVFNV
jgi:hypothetical protein